MSESRFSFKRFLRNDYFIAFLFLLLFLATNRYVYGWDDQHLEIPLLKHLIDPALYVGDYYVESLAKNFSSFLYPLLARVITVDMVPAVYLGLFCLVRYALFFWVYRFWQILSQDRLTAACATLSLFLLGRTEEFIYRTFSHQEFAFAFIFAAIYFFYKDRFILAAVILGVAANFHALYSLFPMIFISVYTLLFVKDRGRTFFKTGVVFVIGALPFLIWHLPHAFIGGPKVPSEQWIPLYLLSCPQCFPLGTPNPEQVVTGLKDVLIRLYPYLFWILFYVAQTIFNEQFRKDKKMHVIFWVSAFFISLCFFAAYVVPHRGILDLNLLRLTQFIQFFLMGYAVVFLMKLTHKESPFYGLMAGVAFPLLAWANNVNIGTKLTRHWILFLILVIWFIVVYVFRKTNSSVWMKKMFLVIPLIVMTAFYVRHHFIFLKVKNEGAGFWQLQRNWEDMQYYVKAHTPKEAVILVPYDMEMGGFRIHSDRQILVSYRDCGIIGFDYAASEEWQNRIKAVESFKVFSKTNILPAVKNAVQDYGVKYIVFMKYYAPQGPLPFLKKMYENGIFSLYQIVQ